MSIINSASLLIFNHKTLDVKTKLLNKSIMRLGRKGASDKNDIFVDSEITSSEHGVFYRRQDGWYYKDNYSTNGTFLDGRHIQNDPNMFKLNDGTVLKIDSANNDEDINSITMIFCDGDFSNQEWANFPLNDFCKSKIYIGRDPEECEFLLESPQISKKHGMFYRKDDDLYYQDLHSTNGTLINGRPMKGSHKLVDKDILVIGNLKMVYTNGLIFYLKPTSGTNLNIRNLTKVVSDSEHIGKKKTILNNINLDVAASELVAVLGTSGAGKSTFLNCVNGYEDATSGSVLINNVDLYKNKKLLKKQIGYVPQEDLLRDGLSVQSTLDYIARLRLPKDTKRRERKRIIDDVLNTLGIEANLKKSKIQKLSGGQRKRISIAMELISNPPIIFLDEPTSGLDPETESMLIEQLRKLAHSSKKTLLVITHTLKNINLFDKVLFLGPGGKACYYGAPNMALRTFGVNDFVDIYPDVRERTDYYAQKYLENFNNLNE